ncbi:hypothetical protein ACSU1N_00735 [Thermogladius sp. 4427co]|uniref:hypothetical protein n=1 Tax=Thermogladius sp. 4427co TaxID=3450718 RepID=UPI003F7A92B4
MKGQVQIIAAAAALGLTIAIVSILYVGILSGVASFRVLEVGSSVYSVIRSKPLWSACELADAIRNTTGSSYVMVNITVYNIVSGQLVGGDYCEVKATGATGYYRIYVYAREDRSGLLYLYSIKVSA